MAFVRKNLRAYGVQEGSGVVPTMYAYYNASDDTVTTPGFVPLDSGLKAGDQVLAISADYATQSRFYVAVAGKQITLTKVTVTV